jgi:hypothetical protein
MSEGDFVLSEENRRFSIPIAMVTSMVKIPEEDANPVGVE